MINKIKHYGAFVGTVCIILVLSFVLGVVPAFANENATEGENADANGLQIAVVARDVSRGIRLSTAHIKMVPIDEANLPPNAITNIDDVLSKYTREDLYEGEYIYAEQLSSQKIDKISGDLLLQELVESKEKYVVVTDYVLPNTGKDLSSILQKLINQNPNRTIYFPAGEYIISTPLLTPADAEKSVSIQLADDAVIKAAANWKSVKMTFTEKDTNGKAMEVDRTINTLIALGAGAPKNDIVSVGSYYSFKGGTLDGNGKADGLSVQSGRESQIRNICIKNFKKYGLYIARGANTNSSDCDFEDITIIGDGSLGSCGIDFRGFDNTVTNIRIYNCEKGIESVVGQGNLFKNIYFYNDPEICQHYTTSIAFRDSGNANNWLSDCYVENYAIAFDLGARSLIWDCTAKWTSDLYTKQIFARLNNATLALGGCRAEFYGTAAQTAFTQFLNANHGTVKMIEGCMFDESLCDDKAYRNHLSTPIIPIG